MINKVGLIVWYVFVLWLIASVDEAGSSDWVGLFYIFGGLALLSIPVLVVMYQDEKQQTKN